MVGQFSSKVIQYDWFPNGLGYKVLGLMFREVLVVGFLWGFFLVFCGGVYFFGLLDFGEDL